MTSPPDQRRTPSAVMPLLAAALLAGFLFGWLCRPSFDAAPARNAARPVPGKPLAAAIDAPPEEAAPPSAGAFDRALAEPAYYRQRQRLGETVAAMDRQAVAAALDREQARRPASRTHVMAALLSRLAELDPAAAATRAAALFNGKRDGSYDLMTAALGPWLAKDRQAAINWWTGLPRGPLRVLVSYALLNQIADSDPREALRLALEKGGGDLNASPVLEIFARLAEQDPRAAMDEALRMPGQEAVRAATERVVAAWAKQNPAEAYAWVRQAKDLPLINRVRSLILLFGAWSESDPVAAGAFLLAHPADGSDWDERTSLESVATIADKWATRDPQAALRWLEQCPAAWQQKASLPIMRTWAATDPRAALMYAVDHPAAPYSDYARSETMDAWVRADLSAARAWVETLPAGAARDELVGRLVRKWSNQDPKAAMDYALAHKDNASVPYTYLLTSWAEGDPDGAVRWSQSLPSTGDRDAALSTLVGTLAEHDLAKAQGLYAQLSPESRAPAAGSLVAAWSGKDPAAAAKWTTALPPGAARDHALVSLAQYWGYRDLPAASDWLSTQLADAARDAAIVKMIDYVGVGSRTPQPERVIALAESIGDRASRDNALQAIARAWLKKDAEAAKIWIAQTPDFSDRQRAALTAGGG